ncbi:MAG: UDP-glucose 4-epimerase GalE [Anaerolineaceae bacterium]|nr:UDP-glucose 4-epimerase GalE [Anaerolineaceae bacterium]
MVKALLDEGHSVIVLDNLCKGHRKAILGGEFIQGDLGDSTLLKQIFSTRKIDCVMHFAAFIEVGESVEDPLKYYINNSGKTLELLNSMKEHRVNRFILSSTAAVYGEPEKIPIEENQAQIPVNPYGRSKQFLETVLKDCRDAYGIQSTCLRYFNAAGADVSGIIGEDHNPESHLIPLVLQVALKQREKINIFGADYPTPDGTCLRDYVHVTDLVRAHLLAAECLLDGGHGGVYNLGCQQGFSVLEIIDMVRKVTGMPILAIESARRLGDSAALVASSARARSDLHWKPRFEDPEEIVATAWKWHQTHPNGYGDRY